MKVASGTSRWALPSGMPRRTPSARASGLGVDDRPRIPRPAAQHERAGREGLGASGPGQVEGQMRDEEVETSHGRGSLDRGPRDAGAWMGAGSAPEGVDEEGVVGEAGVPFAALGVEDPERRLAPRRAVAVVRDERLGALADDVAAQADPRPASQLEPDAGRLGRPRSPGRRRVRAHRGSGAGSPRAGRARRVDGVDRRSWPACRSSPVDRRAGRGRACRPTDRRAGCPRSTAPRPGWPG